MNAPVLINPLQEPAWDALVEGHPGGGFFHGSAWARVLHDTYGHNPVYFGRIESGRLAALLPVIEVFSPWAGRRGVSLPFTDFCLPLGTEVGDARALYELALEHGRKRRWRYLQCRSRHQQWPGALPSLGFYGHVIDLAPGPDALFKAFDGAVRRAIRKAEAAQVRIAFATNVESMRTFYALHCRTRRRHGVPPQPFQFFANIARHVLGQGKGFIAIASLDHRPIAAAVFFHQGRQALYKFGASDKSFQQVRSNNLLMWAAIQRCAAQGCTSLHLGRTSLANAGLRRFKLGFAAREERLEYYKYDLNEQGFLAEVDQAEGWFNRVFRLLPLPLLRLAGELLYPHLA